MGDLQEKKENIMCWLKKEIPFRNYFFALENLFQRIHTGIDNSY